jgi:hypothetical protein
MAAGSWESGAREGDVGGCLLLDAEGASGRVGRFFVSPHNGVSVHVHLSVRRAAAGTGLRSTVIFLSILFWGCQDSPTEEVPRNFTLLVTGAGTGTGAVTGPEGMDCMISNGEATGVCAADFPAGATVTLHAAATSGSGFVGWAFGPSPLDRQTHLTVTLNASRTYSAHFVAGRSALDRPDDFDGPQVHVIYAVPFHGEDRMLDADGTLARSIASFSTWFGLQTDGLALRFDTYQGALDITHLALSRTDEQMQTFATGTSGPLWAIDHELRSASRLQPDKIYLVYYDGGSNYSCGNAMWPGRVAALYLQATPSGFGVCGRLGFVQAPDHFPLYWEFAALHDLIHALGIVSPSAPNHTDAYPGHVPEQNDLMYGGQFGWILNASTTVDVGGDDYFGAHVPPGVALLSESPYVKRVPLTSLGLKPLSPRAAFELSVELTRLPVHPPFPARPPEWP